MHDAPEQAHVRYGKGAKAVQGRTTVGCSRKEGRAADVGVDMYRAEDDLDRRTGL